jgi:hypothetical protein
MASMVLYSKVTLKSGKVDELSLFYSNVKTKSREERNQIERDLAADGREVGVAYVVEWTNEPSPAGMLF